MSFVDQCKLSHDNYINTKDTYSINHLYLKEVVSAEVSKDKGMSILKAHHLCNPLKFTKDMLQSYKVRTKVSHGDTKI